MKKDWTSRLRNQSREWEEAPPPGAWLRLERRLQRRQRRRRGHPLRPLFMAAALLLLAGVLFLFAHALNLLEESATPRAEMLEPLPLEASESPKPIYREVSTIRREVFSRGAQPLPEGQPGQKLLVAGTGRTEVSGSLAAAGFDPRKLQPFSGSWHTPDGRRERWLLQGDSLTVQVENASQPLLQILPVGGTLQLRLPLDGHTRTASLLSWEDQRLQFALHDEPALVWEFRRTGPDKLLLQVNGWRFTENPSRWKDWLRREGGFEVENNRATKLLRR
ncbi:MAG: hypothetical protein D6765_04030 [Bacteroidetes bacterium]|nr:MAG: hypothetical protein D6765_04030 [Bacteroidota bacterium]